MAVDTQKFVGKRVRLDMYCYFADISSYRCVGVSFNKPAVRMDFKTVLPPQMVQTFESKCGSIENATSPKYKFSVEFTYEKHVSKDNAELEVPTVLASDDEGTLSKPRHR